MTGIAFAGAVAALLGAGFAVLRGLGIARGELPGTAAFALAFLLGSGAVGVALLSADAAGVSAQALFALSHPPLVLAGVVLALREVRAGRPGAGLAGLAVAALILVGGLALAGSAPMYHWDERFLWAHKARLIFHEGGVLRDGFLDPERYHRFRSHPLLVPYAEAWVALAVGRFEERAIKLLFPLFFAALIALFHWGLRGRTGGPRATLVTLYLVCLPAWTVRSVPEGGSWDTGFADIPLAACALAAFLLLERHLETQRLPYLVASALALALAVFTKREGAIFALAMGAALAALPPGQRLGARSLALYAAVFAAVLIPFAGFAASVPPDRGLPDADYLALLCGGALWERLGRPEIAGRLAAALSGPRWGGVGIFLVVACASALPRGERRRLAAHAPLLAFAGLPLLAYALAFHLTPYEPGWHQDVALNRLLSHCVPLLAYAGGSLAFGPGARGPQSQSSRAPTPPPRSSAN